MNDLFINGRDWFRGGLAAAATLALLTGIALSADKAADKTGKDKPADKAAKEKPAKEKPGKTPKEPDKPSGSGQFGGWGGSATGGEGKPTVQVDTVAELEAALKKGNCTIQLKAPVLEITGKGISTTASNITLDGQGNTIRGDKMIREQQMLEFEGGKNIIVRNIHLRNGGDNLSFKGASDILVHHVSSTGAGDDGISLAYGTKNATVCWCLVAGATRSVFCKYNNTGHLTLHHNIICKFWIRGPKFHEVEGFDFRNNLVREWSENGWGSRALGKASTGNFVGNIWLCPPDSKGSRKDNALSYGMGAEGGPPGPTYIAQNVFKGCTGLTKGSSDTPIDAPGITGFTTNMDALERDLMSDTKGAGCMPRDKVDSMYLTTKEWSVGATRPFRIPDTGKPLP